MDRLKEKTLQGGVARLTNQAFSFVVRLGSMAVMARLLGPKEFGLVAMATAITGIYALFSTVGLSSATVQRDTVTDEQVSTLFWINIAVGVLLALTCLITAPILAAFYDEPRLVWVTFALGAGFIFNAAGVQHSALLQRQMRFTALAVVEAISLCVSLGIGMTLAWSGFGYWAIVLATIAEPGVATVLKWYASGWVPGRPKRNAGIRSLLRFGGTLTINGAIVYFAYNCDKILLGRFWGADVLGLYARAYSLINIPTQCIDSTVASVAFSALARIQNDPDRLRNYFLKGYSIVMSLAFPITVFCAAFADDLILVLLGPKWQGTVIIFRLLAPTVLIFGMLNPWGWLMQSTGMQDRCLKISFVIVPVVITCYFIGLPYGPGGVACSYSVAMMLLLVPVLAWSIRGTVFSTGDILRSILPPFVSSMAATGCALALTLGCGGGLSPLLRLTLAGSVMVACYLFVLMVVMGQKALYRDLFRGAMARSAKTEVVSLEP